MSNYLLLRNNKESGPYTLDQIRAMGLKAYDLLWIEGKSAAWRYPGEIDELKSFAPPVEEQPFDRFFKKPSTENKPANLAQQAVQTQSADYSTTTTVQETAKRETVSQPNRPIYVTLPANRKIAAEKETVSIPERKPFIPERQRVVEEQEPFARSLSLGAHELAVLEEKFPTLSNDSKKQNPAQAYRPKRSALPDINRLIKPAAIVFSLIALIALGVVIGLLISSGRGKNSTNNIPAAEAVVPGKQAVYKTQKLPPSSLPPAQETTQAGDDKSLSQTNQPVNYNKETVGIEKKKAKTAKAVLADSLLHSNPVAAANKDAEALTAHRETIHKTDAPDAKETIKDNIMDYVAIGASKYTVGTFGGISDLQLTVSNRSTYPLDLVVVEVQYLQSNKKTFKTENIYFHDIGAGSALMQEAPKSPRGIKVQYRITLINSKELGLSYSDL